MVQISWIVCSEDGEEIKREDLYIFEEDLVISEESFKVHGITEEFLRSRGKRRTEVLNALAEEARMMLDEGVVSTPAEIDLCMLMGSGWPMHLGGILPYLDREGISEAVCGQRFHAPGIASLPSSKLR